MTNIKRSCPVCESNFHSVTYARANYDLSKLDEFAFASRKMPEYMHYNLMKCNKCDTVYADMIPNSGQLDSLYEDAAYDSLEESYFASKTYATLLPDIMNKLPDLVGAIDIGTGNGSFLEELLRYGFTDAIGVEPSLAPLATAKEIIKPLIKPSMFHAADFNPESMSLVSCFQTLEHLDNPFSFCSDIYTLLKNNGALMMVTHSHRALSTKLLGEKSPIFDIEHLQLFSPSSLKYLLERAGFRDIVVKNISNSYPMHYWFKLAPFPSSIKKRIYPWLKSSQMGRIALSLPAGNIAVIGYK